MRTCKAGCSLVLCHASRLPKATTRTGTVMSLCYLISCKPGAHSPGRLGWAPSSSWWTTPRGGWWPHRTRGHNAALMATQEQGGHGGISSIAVVHNSDIHYNSREYGRKEQCDSSKPLNSLYCLFHSHTDCLVQRSPAAPTMNCLLQQMMKKVKAT